MNNTGQMALLALFLWGARPSAAESPPGGSGPAAQSLTRTGATGGSGASADIENVDVLDTVWSQNHLQAYHPNYAVLATDHGESRLQFQLSLKYELLEYPERWWNQNWAYYPQSVSVAYDGLYDFYWFSRPASPVISRDQNPGAFIHFVPTDGVRHYDLSFVDMGWFHESDGQTTLTKAQYDALYASQGANSAQDSVHRGWDYWYIGSNFTAFPFDKPESPGFTTVTRFHQFLSFEPSVRLYDGRQGINGEDSEDIFWKPVSYQPYIYDYDGIRSAFSWGAVFPDTTFLHFNFVEVSADFRTGYNYGHFAQNWSRRAMLTFKTGYFPWYLYYSNGYGPYISDYTTFSQGWGIGVRLR